MVAAEPFVGDGEAVPADRIHALEEGNLSDRGVFFKVLIERNQMTNLQGREEEMRNEKSKSEKRKGKMRERRGGPEAEPCHLAVKRVAWKQR